LPGTPDQACCESITGLRRQERVTAGASTDLFVDLDTHLATSRRQWLPYRRNTRIAVGWEIINLTTEEIFDRRSAENRTSRCTQLQAIQCLYLNAELPGRFIFEHVPVIVTDARFDIDPLGAIIEDRQQVDPDVNQAGQHGQPQHQPQFVQFPVDGKAFDDLQSQHGPGGPLLHQSGLAEGNADQRTARQ